MIFGFVAYIITLLLLNNDDGENVTPGASEPSMVIFSPLIYIVSERYKVLPANEESRRT
jgi:hypothetical protein